METPEKVTEEAIINQIIQTGINGNGVNANLISDGYHTFGELYEHRIYLFIALCSVVPYGKYTNHLQVWKSKYHHDGSCYDNWFIMGIGIRKGDQISYH